MANLDSDFIQPTEHSTNPTCSIEIKEIPVIDISSAIESSTLDPQSNKTISNVVKEIGEACEKWGFFQVINHGVPPEKRKRIESAARKFFALPVEEKKKIRRHAESPWGFFDSDHTANVRDWKEMFEFTVEESTLVPASNETEDGEIIKSRNQWPDYPPEFRVACEEYTQEMLKLSFKLLELIALSLDLPQYRLSGFFKDHASLVRINYYPTCPFPHLALGIGPHTDSGALTILGQDEVGGLEVKRKMDGQWIIVKPISDAYIINIGAVIQVWSNDKYESVEHRAKVNPEKERLSIPFFFSPSNKVMVKPMEELVNEKNPARFREYNYGEFCTTRKLNDSKKLNVENIQIEHFRIAE